MELNATKLDYFDDMCKFHSKATLLSRFQFLPSETLIFDFKGDDGRLALILDSTIFYPQGGGQPSDTGLISNAESQFKFIVQDVRSKDGVVFHYGYFENPIPGSECGMELEKGLEVSLFVDEQRRRLNSRLHSAGHLLDICMQSVGLGHLEPGKGYHFPDGPYVEYIGTIPQNEWQSKQKELELDANALISKGGKVYASVVAYEEAQELCGGVLPEYILKSSNPRIVKFGDNPGCPCGGTHVADIAEIRGMKVSQIRTKKGLTKIFYAVVDQ